MGSQLKYSRGTTIIFTIFAKKMRVYFLICLLCAVTAESQIWESNFLPSWFRVAKSANTRNSTVLPFTSEKPKTTTAIINEPTTQAATAENANFSTSHIKNKSTTGAPTVSSTLNPSKVRNMIPVSTTHLSSPSTENSTVVLTTTTTTEESTVDDTTFLESATTEELRDLSRTHEFYLSKRNKPQIKISTNISQVGVFFSRKKKLL